MHARNAGLQRLRSLTRRVALVTAALTAVFSGLAAASNSGHHRHLLSRGRPQPQPSTPTNRVPPPPSLPSLPSGNDGGQPSTPSTSPAPPPQSPVQTQAPPVAVTGGS